MKINTWVTILQADRSFSVEINEAALAEASKFDGCYVLKTELRAEDMSAWDVHDRYKDLALVEQAFRTFKTTHLDLRPIYVRRESRTRGHVFVVMLAYRLIIELKKYWATLDITPEEAVSALTTLCLHETILNNTSLGQSIPKPNELVARLFKEAKVSIPRTVESDKEKVYTKMTLPKHRKKR